jgi:hypothetical protein
MEVEKALQQAVCTLFGHKNPSVWCIVLRRAAWVLALVYGSVSIEGQAQIVKKDEVAAAILPSR